VLDVLAHFFGSHEVSLLLRMIEIQIILLLLLLLQQILLKISVVVCCLLLLLWFLHHLEVHLLLNKKLFGSLHQLRAAPDWLTFYHHIFGLQHLVGEYGVLWGFLSGVLSSKLSILQVELLLRKLVLLLEKLLLLECLLQDLKLLELLIGWTLHQWRLLRCLRSLDGSCVYDHVSLFLLWAYAEEVLLLWRLPT
jgi:hypothetical protein